MRFKCTFFSNYSIICEYQNDSRTQKGTFCSTKASLIPSKDLDEDAACVSKSQRAKLRALKVTAAF